MLNVWSRLPLLGFFLFCAYAPVFASTDYALDCEDRLGHASHALTGLVQQAMKNQILGVQEIDSWIKQPGWSNVFARATRTLLVPRYLRAFVALEGQLNDADRALVKRQLAKVVAEQLALNGVAQEAWTDTQAVLAPKIVASENTGFNLCPIEDNAVVWIDGRPMMMRKMRAGIPSIFDPFRSGESKALEAAKVLSTLRKGIGQSIAFVYEKQKYSVEVDEENGVPLVVVKDSAGQAAKVIRYSTNCAVLEFQRPILVGFEGGFWFVFRQAEGVGAKHKLNLMFQNAVTGEIRKVETPLKHEDDQHIVNIAKFTHRGTDHLVWSLHGKLLVLDLSTMTRTEFSLPIAFPEYVAVAEYGGKQYVLIGAEKNNYLVKIESD